MYNNFVLRRNENETKYVLDEIRPVESLWSVIFGETIDCSIKYTIYRDMPELIDKMLGMLTEQEEEVLRYRFGFRGKFYSLRETGEMLGMPGGRVRQIEVKALRKMRHPSRARLLRRISDRESILQVTKEEIDFKNIIIKKIAEYVVGFEDSAGFVNNIFQKNELKIRIEDAAARNVSLDDLDLDVRTYNCLKRSGVNTLADLLEMTKDEICKIRNMGSKSVERVFEKIWEYKMGTMNNSLTGKYVTARITHHGQVQVYKFRQMNRGEIAECIYEVLTEEYADKGIVIDYQMSMELKSLLLFKGYFFVEHIIADAEIIKREFELGGYKSYVKEFEAVVKRLKDCFDNESHTEVRYSVIYNEVALNIINRNPKSRDELFMCFMIGDAVDDEELKKKFMELFSEDIQIDISDSISLNDNENDIMRETEDDEIIKKTDIEEDDEE